MTTLPQKDLLRPDEVATYFRVSLRTVYRWIDEGKLKALKVGKKVTRIKRDAVLRFSIPA